MDAGGELEQVREATGMAKTRQLRPSECRSMMRRTLATEFPGIVEGFVKAAKTGSCPHVKLATELLKPIRKSPSKKKGTATLIWERIQREEKQRQRQAMQNAPEGTIAE